MSQTLKQVVESQEREMSRLRIQIYGLQEALSNQISRDMFERVFSALRKRTDANELVDILVGKELTQKREGEG